MRTFSYSKPLFHGLTEYFRDSKLAKAELSMGWTLIKLAGWTTTVAVIAVLIWHTTVEAPIWSHATDAVLLATIGLLAGLRISSQSATGYIKDVQRLNKVLAEQNKNLEAANNILLKELSSADMSTRAESA